MRFKKLLISASAVAAGSGLLATVLTSCGQTKIDDELKVKLDDGGKLAGDINYKTAIDLALKRSSSWNQFKSALADEIVYQWYVNRASKDKNDKTKNTTFRTNLDEWKYKIDQDYKDTVNNCKTKYGSKYKFYLQNEHLAPNGGSEESYKHAKLVEKVRTDFIDNVFATSYFGVLDNGQEPTPGRAKYPQIYSKASLSINYDELKKQENWSKLDFFATTNSNFVPGDGKKIDTKYLAKHPDGDYAMIQKFVFEKWFATEKPFFTAAALFKYSNPAQSEGKLSNIYNSDKASSLDNPSEAYPFFGGVAAESNDSSKGTRAFWEWYNALLNSEFETAGIYYESGTPVFNQTVTIPKKYTEDSQTLLLTFGNRMVAGASDTLYTPYAVADTQLYTSMMGSSSTYLNPFKNQVQQSALEANVDINTQPLGEDDARILKNFMFHAVPTGVTSYLDLSKIYNPAVAGQAYHCDLFKKNDNYTYLYGDPTKSTVAEQNGVRYVTNNIEVELGSKNHQKGDTDDRSQPWVLELNEAGVHAQTIDGYPYVLAANDVTTKQKRLMEVVKYRLMQQKCKYNDEIISANVFDENGQLKTYFKDNFANIVLEIASINEEVENVSNVFRNIESYDDETIAKKDYLITQIATDQHFGDVYELCEYLDATAEYDEKKKNYDAVIAADNKILSYRKTQVTNAKNRIGKKIYENGVLAPIAITPAADAEFDSVKHYTMVGNLIAGGDDASCGKTELGNAKDDVAACTFITTATGAKVDGESGFSPRIADAKKVISNRFWYKSAIADKMMYTIMADASLANQIKSNAYTNYDAKVLPDTEQPTEYDFDDILTGSQTGIDSTFYVDKLLSGDNNFASYTQATTFFNTMENAWTAEKAKQTLTDGEYSTELTEFELFKATLAYLAKNNFENFYTTLNSKIGDNEQAIIGYLAKYDTWYTNTEIGYTPSDALLTLNQVEKNPYVWTPNVDNIFDDIGYDGRTQQQVINSKVGFDQYWHVVTNGTQDFGGFLGIQTKTTNELDSASGLQTAAFDGIAKATYQSLDLSKGTPTAHSQNDGALFAWAGEGKTEDEYKFADVVYTPSEGGDSITAKFSDFDSIPAARKLAHKIATSSTLDDLRTLAKRLGAALWGDVVFSMIGDGKLPLDTKDYIDQLKVVMLNELSNSQGASGIDYSGAFERLHDVELHGEPGQGSPYCFTDGRNGYKLLVTQINRSDVYEKTLTPTRVGGQWVAPASGISLFEFWYIFCKMATESSIQQLAVADVVSKVYGKEKLVVHDAQLYNQFDSVWIKDWEKKPIGEDK